jgi:hypothetical protein
MMKALSATLTKSMLNTLPGEVAEKFELDEEEFKAFLNEYLSNQLQIKQKRVMPRGTNGKGRIGAYMVFSGEHRPEIKEENPDMTGEEVRTLLSKDWGALSDEEKAEWKAKADKINEDNGLPTPTPDAAKAAPKKAPAMSLVREDTAQVWLVKSTNFIVASPKNKTVTGVLAKGKSRPLKKAELKTCADNGWKVKQEQEQE